MANLYLVSTPIGNLEDITLRALRILKEVDWVAAEDTRTSGRLLQRYEIKQRLLSLHEHNEAERIDQIIATLARDEDVALISDAGTPLLSDPGYLLVQTAIAAGHEVIPIPGASALLAALVASGLPCDRFTFLGFPPRKSKARQAFLQNYRDRSETLICYESPRRLPALLADIVIVMGAQRPLVVARELTKLHETIWRGTAVQAQEAFATPPLGEIVLLIGGAVSPPPPDTTAALEIIVALQQSNMPLSAAVQKIAQLTGLPRRLLYEQALQQQKESESAERTKS